MKLGGGSRQAFQLNCISSTSKLAIAVVEDHLEE